MPKFHLAIVLWNSKSEWLSLPSGGACIILGFAMTRFCLKTIAEFVSI